MSTDSTSLPDLTAMRVADDRDVEPLLGRAAADLSALTVRLGVATHRADSAEAKAGRSLDDEAVLMRARLDEERDEHRRELDGEVALARAEAAEVIAAARSDALDAVRMASIELGIALDTFGAAPVAAPAEVEVEPPGDVEPEVEVEVAAVEVVEAEPADLAEPAEPVDEVEEPLDDLAAFAPDAQMEQAPPSLLVRVVQLDAVRLVAVVVLLIVLLTWVR